MNDSSSPVSVTTDDGHQLNPVSVHTLHVLSLTVWNKQLIWMMSFLWNSTMGVTWPLIISLEHGSGLRSPCKSLEFWCWSKFEEQQKEEKKTSLKSDRRLSLQPFILIPVDTCYFFDGKYKAVLGNIRRVFDMWTQIEISFNRSAVESVWTASVRPS